MRFLTLDHRPHSLPPSVSFSMNDRCARKLWNAGAPSNADHEPNTATKAGLAELARNHVYYEVAMLRTATSTTTTVRLPIRCQQATST